MKKILTLMMTLAFVSVSYFAEAQKIRVLPLSSDIISEEAASLLYSRLNQAVSLNGMGSTDNSNKFLMIPSVTVLSIEPTATAPVKYMAEVEIAIYMVDNSRKILLSQELIVKKGVGANEAKAVSEALKSLNARDPKLKKMIAVGKNRIIEYYNAECENVVKTINAYLECGMTEEALNELNAIPQIDEITGCYDNTLNILSKISQEQQGVANDKIKNENLDVSWINE
ncbi:MAG: hypothetical protein IKU01_08845 [Bacteroidales bacterium]|nr:hypothetical protein [Bacteroidales bacterium]